MSVGVVGAGPWGMNIIRTLDKLGHLSAVADISDELRDRARGACPSANFYTNHEDLLNSDIAMVCVATPASTHFEIARDAILAGKDVFVEKPLTLRFDDANALVELANEHKRILMVGHMLIYQPAIQFIKKAIQEAVIGRVLSFHQERLNLGRARPRENVLWSLGVHDVAVLLDLAGGQSPSRVSTFGQEALQAGIADDFYLHMQFENGVHASLHTSWLWPEKRRVLTVVGTEGMLVYDEAVQKVVLHEKSIGPDLANRDLGDRVIFEGDSAPLTLELQHFVHCVDTRTEPLTSGQRSLQVVRVLEHANRN